MIHHHNGALMAAVKIIFDRPALSWPLSFLFVFLSLSLLSLFFPTILSVTHSEIGSACDTSASDTTVPIKILPVKHLLTWHTVKHHIYFLGSRQLWPFLSLHSCIWPILGSFFSWWRSRAGDSRRADAFISPRLSDTFYLYSRVFFLGDGSQTAQPLPFKYLQTPGSASVYSNKQNKKWRPLVKIINVVRVREGQETQPLPEMCEHFKLGTSLGTAAMMQIIDDQFTVIYESDFMNHYHCFYTWIKLLC